MGSQGMSAMRRYVGEDQSEPLTKMYHLLERSPKMFKGKIMNLTVIEKDARTVHQPHSDALVITSVIVNVHASTIGRQWEFCKYFSLWHISEIEAFG